MRRLIINADDFGLTAGVNRGIAECLREGVVTSATLMANAPCVDGATALSHEMSATPLLGGTIAKRSVGIGCHVALMDGTPLLPASLVPSLVSDSRGQFHASFRGFARAAIGKRLDPKQINAEVEAQLHRLQSAGMRLSHLDTHKHAHLFPAVLQPVLRAARTCGVHAVRNPFAPVKPLAFARLWRRPHLWIRYTEVKLMRVWAEAFRRMVAAEGMVTTDGTFGIVSTGALDMELFRAIIGGIPEGTWEFCCHPGYDDEDLKRMHTRLRASRDRERDVLSSATAREIIRQHGIELISYWDLQ